MVNDNRATWTKNPVRKIKLKINSPARLLYEYILSFFFFSTFMLVAGVAVLIVGRPTVQRPEEHNGRWERVRGVAGTGEQQQQQQRKKRVYAKKIYVQRPSG